MIAYVNGAQIQVSGIYKAFMKGFSDYIIKIDMEEDTFNSRFFGPEGNALELCHVALSDGEPIGVVLGGIREWDGQKTLRCGTLSIAPAFRGTDVAKTLLALHWKDATDYKCNRISLEVLKGNARAIRFYEKNGYFASYDIKYFKIKADDLWIKSEKSENPVVSLKEVDIKTLEAHRKGLSGIHINWQSELDYYREPKRSPF